MSSTWIPAPASPRTFPVFHCDSRPLWQPNNPQNPGDLNDTSAVWISDAETGYGDSQFQPYEGTTPVVTVVENFQSGLGFLQLNVWADDTADVILDGNYPAHATGTAPAAAVPEPAQALPLGGVLIGLALTFRHKWKMAHTGR
jgi:hypothetical protein